MQILTKFLINYQSLAFNEYADTNYYPNPVDQMALEFDLWTGIVILVSLVVLFTLCAYVCLTAFKKRLQ